MKRFLRLGVAATALAFAAGVAAGATAPLKLVEAGGATFPDRSYILSLPSKRVLTTHDLRVTENGKGVNRLRVVGQGSTLGRSAVVLALDTSDSMSGQPIADALTAARTFAAGRAPNQSLAIVSFNHSVDVLQPFTTSASAITSVLEKTPEMGAGTKIYDGLTKSLELIEAAKAPAATIILLSDGTDIGSVAKPTQALAALRKAHVRVFAVGLVSRTFDSRALSVLGTATSGSFVRADGPAQLTPIFDQIRQRLSSEYLLSYRSRRNPDTHVSVQVAVRGAGVATTAYVSPPLHFAPPPPLVRSTFDRIVQSSLAMLAVVLVISCLLLAALINLVKDRSAPLIERVGGFVSVHSPAAKSDEQSRRHPLARPRKSLTRRSTILRRWQTTERLRERLELADIAVTPMQVVLLTAAATLLVMLIFEAIVGPIGLLAAVIAVPYTVRALILSRLAGRRRAFAEQLPDNLDVLASALRSGHSLVGALTVVANDATEPSRSEFNRVIADEQFGMQLEDALKVTVARMESSDLDQVALVARLQREMGSNSAEVLDRVVETVRVRMELRRLVRTLTAQGRLSRWILTGLPIALALILSLVNKGYMDPLFNTGLGRFLLIMATVMVALGSFAIGKLIDIKA